MRMLRVTDSSNVSEVGYDMGMKQLRVRFANGKLYEYVDVGAPTFVELVTAQSVGKFFSKHVKGKYRFVLLEEKPKSEPFDVRARAALTLIASSPVGDSLKDAEDTIGLLRGCVAAAQEVLED